jgi:hypothetical protein
VRQYRRATEAAELSREASQQAGRKVTYCWDDDGETKLSNLVSLCRFHHRQVHEGRIAIERLDDGAWRFGKPGGDSFVSAATRWRGERMDHVWVMDVLMQRWERSRGNVAAATAGMNP